MKSSEADMWNLDDEKVYTKIHSFMLQEAFTYADMRPGQTDKEKRERIRNEANKNFPANVSGVAWWAFRIYVRKSGNRPFDIENVPKLIVDAFCKKQIVQDRSVYEGVGLYNDDTIDYVRVVQVGGERSNDDSTIVEIFGKNR
jgi:hypothetical protein